MPQSIVAPSDRQATSLATGVLLGVGVALYQLTSLTLAPASNQQISLSLRTVRHEPAPSMPPGRGPSLEGALAVSYLDSTVESAPHPPQQTRPSSGIGSSSARRPVPPSIPVVTPVDPPVVPQVDSEKRNHHRSDGDGGGRRERD